MARDKRLLVALLTYFDGDDDIRFDAWDAETIRRHRMLLLDGGHIVEDPAGWNLRLKRHLASRLPKLPGEPFRIHDDGTVWCGDVNLADVRIDLGRMLPEGFGGKWFRLTSAGYDLLESLTNEEAPGQREPVAGNGKATAESYSALNNLADPRRDALLMKLDQRQQPLLKLLWRDDGSTPIVEFNTLAHCFDSTPSDDAIRKRLERLGTALEKHRRIVAARLDVNGTIARLVLPE